MNRVSKPVRIDILMLIYLEQLLLNHLNKLDEEIFDEGA